MEKVPARRVPAVYKLKGVRITGGAARRWGSGQSRVKGRAAISRRQARTTAGMSIEEREREEASRNSNQPPTATSSNTQWRPYALLRRLSFLRFCRLYARDYYHTRSRQCGGYLFYTRYNNYEQRRAYCLLYLCPYHRYWSTYGTAY